MEANQCPRVITCPLFNGTLLKRAESADTYRNLYCNAGKEKYDTCKRKIVAETVGKCPDYVMPNSMYSVEQIIERMKKEGMI